MMYDESVALQHGDAIAQLTQQRLERQRCVSSGDDSVSDVTYENSVDTEARHVKHTELSSFILNVY